MLYNVWVDPVHESWDKEWFLILFMRVQCLFLVLSTIKM